VNKTGGAKTGKKAFSVFGPIEKYRLIQNSTGQLAGNNSEQRKNEAK